MVQQKKKNVCFCVYACVSREEEGREGGGEANMVNVDLSLLSEWSTDVHCATSVFLLGQYFSE